MPLTKTEIVELKRAKALLENPSLVARTSAMLGSPIDKGVKMRSRNGTWQSRNTCCSWSVDNISAKGKPVACAN